MASREEERADGSVLVWNPKNRWVLKETVFTKLAKHKTKPLRHTNSSEMGDFEGF